LQPDYKSLQLFPIIRSVVDVVAKLPDFVVNARISFGHISLLRPELIEVASGGRFDPDATTLSIRPASGEIQNADSHY
jgi:hypothetical protein